jgi:YVTN family beta-propeller protein
MLACMGTVRQAAGEDRQMRSLLARLTVVAAVPAALALGLGTPAIGSASRVASSAAAQTTSHPVTLYVLNQGDGTVTPIDTVTNKPGKAIPLATPGSHDGAGPMAITPNGRTVYVLNTNPNVESATPISTATNKSGRPIPVAGIPAAIAITPNSKTAYVANMIGGSLTPINTATDKPGGAINVGGEPYAMAITPNGATAYVVGTGPDVDSITPVNTATNKPDPLIAGKYGAPVLQTIAITPNGKTVYVANWAPRDTVTPISTATNKPGKPIKVGKFPAMVAITPNGKTVYVTNIGSNSVTPISTATNKAGRAIGVRGSPVALAIAPNGKIAYVATTSTVVAISTATDKVVRIVKIASTNVTDIVITPNSKTIYVLYTAAGGYAGRVVPVSAATFKTGKAIKVGNFPDGAVVTP